MDYQKRTGDIIQMFEERLKTRPKTTYIMTLTDTGMRSFKGSKIDRAWGIMDELGKEAADALGVRGSFTHTVMSMIGEVTATNGHPNVLMVSCNNSCYGIEKAFRGLANYLYMTHTDPLADGRRMPTITVFIDGLDDDIRKPMFDALYPIDWIRIIEVLKKGEQ